MTRFYTKLFQSSGKNIASQLARTELLRYTIARVTTEQQKSIKVVPTREEVRITMKRMPKEKSPGLDGMTVEVLSICWSFISNDCINMIKHFWSTGDLSHNFRTGVMKAIPKN